ncbi:MAG: hypothetical protein AAFX93_18530 [Verrucomicrobiota bacterium]
MKVTRENDAIVIDIDFDHSKPNWFLLNSDRHWDNPSSDQAMMKRHLEKARERNAPVLDFGDFFCAMQGKYDKRSNKSSIRPEHQNGNYLDSLVETAVDFLNPYRDLLAFMGPGNHETSIQDRHETDLTERLVALLRSNGSQVCKHRYSGFTRLNFRRKDGRVRGSKVMWHTHGYGGGGPVTKDVIQASRQGVFLEGVDLVVSGHTHDAWVMPQATRALTCKNRIVESERLHVKIPSAKNKHGKDSWEDLKGMPPKPIGAYWLKAEFSSVHDAIFLDVERAR